MYTLLIAHCYVELGSILYIDVRQFYLSRKKPLSAKPLQSLIIYFDQIPRQVVLLSGGKLCSLTYCIALRPNAVYIALLFYSASRQMIVLVNERVLVLNGLSPRISPQIMARNSGLPMAKSMPYFRNGRHKQILTAKVKKIPSEIL